MGRHPRGLRGQCAPEIQLRSFTWDPLTNPTSTHALNFPSFLILPSHLFYSPSFLEWSGRKKINKNIRGLSCNHHEYKEAKQDNKRWFWGHCYTDSDAFEPSLIAVLLFRELSAWCSVLCYRETKNHIVWKLRNMSNNFSLRISNIRFSLEKTANLVYILPKLFKNVQFASKRYTGIMHTVTAFINQVLDSSAIWHNWVQLSNGGDEQILDNTNTRTLGRSGACWKSTFPNSSIRWCSKSANREGSAALQ